MGQFQTLVELRADVHTRIEQMLKERQEAALAERIVNKRTRRTRSTCRLRWSSSSAASWRGEFAAQARRMGQRVTKEQAQAAMHDRSGEAEKKVRAAGLLGGHREEAGLQDHRGGHREEGIQKSPSSRARTSRK